MLKLSKSREMEILWMNFIGRVRTLAHGKTHWVVTFFS